MGGGYRGALTVEIGSLEGTRGVVYASSRWTVSALWFHFLVYGVDDGGVGSGVCSSILLICVSDGLNWSVGFEGLLLPFAHASWLDARKISQLPL